MNSATASPLASALLVTLLRRHLRPFLTGLRQADGDRLFRVLHLLARLAADLELALLELVHRLLDFLRRLLAVFPGHSLVSRGWDGRPPGAPPGRPPGRPSDRTANAMPRSAYGE